MGMLNDGIYHPIYNENGWRRRSVSGVSYEWYTDLGLNNIKTYRDCFKETLINSSDTVSARPDGLKLDDQGTTSFEIVNW